MSTTLASDEILLDLLGSHRLVAVTQFADDPLFSNIVPKVAHVPHRVVSVAAEQILSWQPSAVVASEFNSPDVLQQLEQEHIAVLRLADPTSLAEIRANIEAIAAFCHTPSEPLTEPMMRHERSLKDSLTAPDRRRAVRVLLWLGGSTGGYTAGSGTLFDELVRLAGARNAAADHGLRGHAALGVERALALDPDVVVRVDAEIDRHARTLFSAHRSRDQWARRSPSRSPAQFEVDPDFDPVWRLTRAGHEGHLRTVPAKHVLSTSHHALRLADDLRLATNMATNMMTNTAAAP